jgi:hypothetical protein
MIFDNLTLINFLQTKILINFFQKSNKGETYTMTDSNMEYEHSNLMN